MDDQGGSLFATAFEPDLAAGEAFAPSVAGTMPPAHSPVPAPLLPLTLATAGALLLEGCGDSSPTPTPTPTPTATPASVGVTMEEASRFLSQAAIGHSKADITSVSTSGFSAWLNAQFALARPQKFWDFLIANGYNAAGNVNNGAGFDAMMWGQLMGSADILRQRVGYALLSQWVVGFDGLTGAWRQFTMAAYLDVLWDNAFGNYRDIMEGVSTSAAMGIYLTFLGNLKANPVTGASPDENYARELMQLFTIGLYQLNIDGSVVTSGGNPVPTYTQADVSQAARVWTGYAYAGADISTPNRVQQPLIVNPAQHETGATAFLDIVIPAGSDGATARKLTLDGLFANASLPPFVCKQLIQHMVTSNPSPGYISRVASVFVNNGSGVRGDMKAVIRAILTDSEVRNMGQVSTTTFGKLREPIVRLIEWARAFNVTSPTNLWPFGNTSAFTRLFQEPGRSPSVFNWFRPGYTPGGTAIATSGLVAPEFQLVSEPAQIAYINFLQQMIVSGAGEAKADYSAMIAIAADSQALLNEINLILAANQISAATIAQMKTALDTIAVATSAGILNRIYAAIVLVMASPEYLVAR